MSPPTGSGREGEAADLNDDAPLRCEISSAIEVVGTEEWQLLQRCDSPFLRHEYLAAMEQYGCVGGDTGWQPAHIVARTAAGELAGVLPVYSKEHSWGEFVFDWAWADAYQRAGLAYYPKLIVSVPFTPVTGPRLLRTKAAPTAAVNNALLTSLERLAVDRGVSSAHILFPQEDELAAAREHGFLSRKDCRFLWRNRNYRTFDDFLAALSSSKRKKIRRERRRVGEAGISIAQLPAREVSAAQWASIDRFYARTFLVRGHRPYFPPGFFAVLAGRMGEQMRVVLASEGGNDVAAAVFFHDLDTLYGRYWGCAQDYHSLHFEVCYYQGIDYAIEAGLGNFDPGTQGEHKLARGFEPVPTWSAHWLRDPRFEAAIGQWLKHDRRHVDDYMLAAAAHLPYRSADHD